MRIQGLQQDVEEDLRSYQKPRKGKEHGHSDDRYGVCTYEDDGFIKSRGRESVSLVDSWRIQFVKGVATVKGDSG